MVCITSGETKQVLMFSRIEKKTLHHYMFVIPDPKCIFKKTKISRLEKLHPGVNARTCQFPVLLQKITFGGNFIRNACVASFSTSLIFFVAKNDSTLMEMLFLQLIFKRETKLSVI